MKNPTPPTPVSITSPSPHPLLEHLSSNQARHVFLFCFLEDRRCTLPPPPRLTCPSITLSLPLAKIFPFLSFFFFFPQKKATPLQLMSGQVLHHHQTPPIQPPLVRFTPLSQRRLGREGGAQLSSVENHGPDLSNGVTW